MSGVVLDTGALIALERGDRDMLVLVAETRASGDPIAVPAGCVAQAWRAPARQARMAGLLRLPNVTVVALDDEDARLVGLLLARTRTNDVTDAHVALCAIRTGRPVLTSDPADIRALGPEILVEKV